VSAHGCSLQVLLIANLLVHHGKSDARVASIERLHANSLEGLRASPARHCAAAPVLHHFPIPVFSLSLVHQLIYFKSLNLFFYSLFASSDSFPNLTRSASPASANQYPSIPLLSCMFVKWNHVYRNCSAQHFHLSPT
jgi:hypothetical protein